MEKPTIKRKEREREARREAILDAAARVFSSKSYFEATLDEIAVEAELAKGTLYNYYKDKQDIFFSLIDRGLLQFQEALIGAVTSGGKLRQLLVRCFDVSLEAVREHKYMYRHFLTGGAELSEKFRSDLLVNWHNQSFIAAEKLAEALASVPETSKLSPADRLTGAQLVFAAIHSLHHRQMLEDDAGSLKEDIDNFTRLLCRALTLE
jgi:AcrR family transcriptional regulator